MEPARNNQPAGPPVELIDADIGPAPDDLLIEKLTWSVGAEDFWVVGGLHGAGKTQLMATAAGLQRTMGGRHLLFGRDTAEYDPEELVAERLRTGLLFDNGRLLRSLTIAENVALPLQYHRDISLADASDAVKTVLDLVEIAHLANYLPGQLGRNWQLRAGLARALVLKPEVLLCDNPGTGLDPRHSRWWVDFLTSLAGGHPWLGRKLALVVATDNLRPWIEHGKQFAVLKKKRWLAIGGRAELDACADPLLHEMLATGNT